MSIKEYRKLRAKGMKMEQDSSDGIKNEIKLVIKGSDGKKTSLNIPLVIHHMSGLDYSNFHNMQLDWTDVDDASKPDVTKPKIGASRYAAAVVCTCKDETGEKLFDREDLKVLDHPLNAQETIRIATIAFAINQDEAIDAAEKQS